MSVNTFMSYMTRNTENDEGGTDMNIQEKFCLKGKKAVVTGGAQGIGFNYAMAVAGAGADVVLADLNGEKAGESADFLEKQYGVKAMAVRTDVTQPEQVENMCSRMIEEMGRIDIAFCNAGISINVPAEEMSFEQWKKVIDINLTGVFLTATAVGRYMLRQGSGSIINTASMSGHIVNIPQPQVAYNASKAGVIMLTKSLAVEWAQKNVRVNSISPGYIMTDLIEGHKLIPEWTRLSPLKRMGCPEELQGIALYLASDASTFTTGADFTIDGAYTCV